MHKELKMNLSVKEMFLRLERGLDLGDGHHSSVLWWVFDRHELILKSAEDGMWLWDGRNHTKVEYILVCITFSFAHN